VLLGRDRGRGDGVDRRGMADPTVTGLASTSWVSFRMSSPGGGKHQRLALRGQCLTIPPDVREKAHVKHASASSNDRTQGCEADRLWVIWSRSRRGRRDDVDALRSFWICG